MDIVGLLESLDELDMVGAGEVRRVQVQVWVDDVGCWHGDEGCTHGLRAENAHLDQVSQWVPCPCAQALHAMPEIELLVASAGALVKMGAQLGELTVRKPSGPIETSRHAIDCERLRSAVGVIEHHQAMREAWRVLESAAEMLRLASREAASNAFMRLELETALIGGRAPGEVVPTWVEVLNEDGLCGASLVAYADPDHPLGTARRLLAPSAVLEALRERGAVSVMKSV